MYTYIYIYTVCVYMGLSESGEKPMVPIDIGGLGGRQGGTQGGR